VSGQRIELLLESRVLERIEPDERALLGYWEKARRADADARLPGTSTEGAFDRAYQAAFLLATATLHASGYRVRGRAGGHHYNTFYAISDLGAPELVRLGGELNDLRGRRHEALYEAVAELPVADLERLRSAADEFFHIARNRLIAAYPELAGRLR